MKQRVKIISYAILPFLIACEDRVMNDLQEVAKQSTVVTVYPKEVKKVIDEKILTKNPRAKYQVVGVMEMTTESGKDALENLSKSISMSDVKAIHVIKDVKSPGKSDFKHYFILERGLFTDRLASVIADSEGVFTLTEEMPLFPGGTSAWDNFLERNLSYPKTAKDKGISGNSYVQFVVTEDGALSHIKLLKGFDLECDTEAIRVAKLSPPWLPGKHNGQSVKVRLVVPISFNL